MKKPTARPGPSRDLSRAVTLRARDILDLYGIPASTLCDLARHPDAARRPPSRLIRGRQGRRGVRLFPRAAFEQWLARWSEDGEYAA
jgi:hypothetical protein